MPLRVPGRTRYRTPGGTPQTEFERGFTHVKFRLASNARLLLDDVALVPTRRTHDRRDVDTSWQIDAFSSTPRLLARPWTFRSCPGDYCPKAAGGEVWVLLNLEGLWTRYEEPAAAARRDR